MASVCVGGIGRSEYGKALPQSPWELALTAAAAAIEDAGLEPRDIDGVCRFNDGEDVSVPMIVRGLGLERLRFIAEMPLGGEASGLVIAAAADAIKSGRAKAVLIYRALSMSTGGRYGRADEVGPASGAGAEDIVVDETDNNNFALPYGLVTPAHHFGLQASRYMYSQGVSESEMEHALGAIAIGQRAYANRNPRAIMRDRQLDRDRYHNARMISWPLRLFDLCIENDGATAVVLTSDDVCRTKDAIIDVRATSESLLPYSEPLGLYLRDLDKPFHRQTADDLYREAGVTPQRIRVAELYDAFSIMVMTSLDGYGLTTAPAWRHLSEFGVGLDSPLPINTHGGHLSEAYIHGLNGFYEAVEQLRGTANNQVAGADVALVGAPLGSASILAVR